jgi:hypothetical protein
MRPPTPNLGIAIERLLFSCQEGYAMEGEMKYAVVLISIVLVLGLAGGGYEINHLRTEVNGLQTQVTNLNKGIDKIFVEVEQLMLGAKP